MLSARQLTETSEVMRKESQAAFEGNGGNRKKKPYLTTCQYERLQLLPLLQAWNGNEVMTTMIVHNRRSHADADT